VYAVVTFEIGEPSVKMFHVAVYFLVNAATRQGVNAAVIVEMSPP
jgi:hypothetical protein